MSLFGWTLCALGVFALLALLITSGDIRDHTAGTGERRITRRGQLAAQRKRIADLEQQIACCPTCTPREPGFPTVDEIAASDRSDPAPTISAPAPVDNGCRDTPRANAETQPVDVRDLRAAMGEDDTVTLPAVTASIPAVTTVAPQPQAHINDDTQMLVTWGTGLPAKTKGELEDWAIGTAPGPMHEVPVGLGAKASVNVTAALEEAS